MVNDSILFVVALALVVAIGVYVARKPISATDYQTQITSLRAMVVDYQNQITALRNELNTQRTLISEMSKSMDRVLQRNFTLFNELASVHDELQRVNAIGAWTRQQLRELKVELPPIPAELRESRLLPPSVAINIDQQSGGVRVDDSNVDTGGDMIGGNKQ